MILSFCPRADLPSGRQRRGSLMSVIEEEMGDYTAGGKSAKQVLDIIQNREQLYLNKIY